MKTHVFSCRMAAMLLAASALLSGPPSLTAGPPVFSCPADNDLFRVASDNGMAVKRCDTPEAAVAAAGEGDGVLLLAGGYRLHATGVPWHVFAGGGGVRGVGGQPDLCSRRRSLRVADFGG